MTPRLPPGWGTLVSPGQPGTGPEPLPFPAVVQDWVPRSGAVLGLTGHAGICLEACPFPRESPPRSQEPQGDSRGTSAPGDALLPRASTERAATWPLLGHPQVRDTPGGWGMPSPAAAPNPGRQGGLAGVSHPGCARLSSMCRRVTGAPWAAAASLHGKGESWILCPQS